MRRELKVSASTLLMNSILFWNLMRRELKDFKSGWAEEGFVFFRIS